MIQQLNENWILQSGTAEGIRTNIPCSVYDCLIRAGKIPDPYFGENQYAALELSDGNYVFEHTFSPARDILSCEKIYLRFNGIDTLAEISLNGSVIGRKICTAYTNTMLPGC